jgi:hypothetical protein
MSDDIAVKRGPGRPPNRVEEVKAERRRRIDPGENGQGPLGLSQSKQDPGFHYHWINDTPGRLHEKTVNDDYDKVEDPSLVLGGDTNSEGSAVRRLVGAHADGKPKYAYLCRKPIEYYKKDRLEKQATVNDLEKQIRGGKVKDGLSTDDPHSYVPDGAASPVQIVRPEPRRSTQSYEP